MRLFVSYARVDRPFCEQIVETLESAHEVWFDKRLHAGKKWWDQITGRLAWCEGFVYLLSPESVESEYCRKEYAIADGAGKAIFPVIIQPGTAVPDDLRAIQLVDCSAGLTATAATALMAGIYLVEREGWDKPAPAAATEPVGAPVIEISEGAMTFGAALDDLDAGHLDSALFKLLQLKESGYSPGGFVDLAALIADAQGRLDQQAYLREAEREYTPIVQLARRAATRLHGCAAFARFRERFPDYDPEGLAAVCAEAAPKAAAAPVRSDKKRDILDILPPPFEWCEIPAGRVTLEDDAGTFDVRPFLMAKYPITHAQFQVFVDDPQGWKNPAWWEGLAADDDHKQQPGAAGWPAANHPRENVSWYDAVAFCRWLTARVKALTPGPSPSGRGKWEIRLPTEWEWQWAAQGSDGREYPWGDTFDSKKCNTYESGQRKTRPVTMYPKGASPYGVMDMAGNVWEWCLNAYSNPDYADVAEDVARVVRGGSWYFNRRNARCAYRDGDVPSDRYINLGFRVVVAPPISHGG